MTEIQFGRLKDLPLREAWKHEAHEFTPWLAKNIDHLAEVIGIPLELTGTEVAVESFSADILARNPMDDTVVLIENQLETTDHTHLGQIMTYLAGLEAQTVVWIAPTFRQPHLSAIRWLNEHTSDGFSFFAIKARVVRIGESPVAPIFEVVEEPDEWMRKVRSETPRARDSELRELRQKYFEALMARMSDWKAERRNRLLYFEVAKNPELSVCVEIQRKRQMICVVSDTAEEFGELTEQILAAVPDIETTIGNVREARWGGALFKSRGCTLTEVETWEEALQWHVEWLNKYLKAFTPEGPTK